MSAQYKIYLDVCCLNRPFDSWQQDRVRLEAEAVLAILERIRDKHWQLISSEVIEAELKRLPNPDKLTNILNLLALVSDRVVLNDAIDQRSQGLEDLGFGLYDAFHIACAEQANVDVLLTTDDRLLKLAMRYNDNIHVQLDNPVNWLMTVLLAEGNPENDTH
jgi:predicted nucleic acid-binding protein